MLKYALRRILQAIPTIFILSIIVFYAIRFIPGGSQKVVFRGENATHYQYVDFIKNAFQGDFGHSFVNSRPVMDEVLPSFRLTLIITSGGIFFATVIGIFLGIIAAVHKDRLLDNLIMVLSLVTASMPLFFTALVLMLIFSLHLGLVPSIGMSSWKGMILPMVTLGLPAVGFFTRTARTAMIDVLSQDYIRTSKARGIPEVVIIFAHAFKNTLVPLLTAIGVRFGELLAGTVLVENAFSIPGLGRLLINSITMRDYPLIQTSVLCLAIAFIIMNIMVDLLYTLADPRVRYQ